MARGIYETVLSGFERDDQHCLQEVYDDLVRQINVSRKSSVDELVSAVNSTSSFLSRNFGAEKLIPKDVRDRKGKAFTAIR